MLNCKKLFVIRHAKSSWKDSSLDDFDRPLNKRGKLNAPFMGTKLKEKNVLPDIIIASPAKRAKSTAEVIAKKVNYSKNIVFKKDIYDVGERAIRKILKKLDDKNSVVFLFGHNPDLEILVEEYVEFDENIPTCGIVEIEFDCKRWRDISAKNAKLISFDYPKRYREVR
ncbi:MAG: histidine phosphatase family protein [Campylobacterota bacterium]